MVGFADGDDPLFEQYKTVIGPAHLAPREVLSLQSRASGAEVVEPAQVGVVSWVLPMAKKTRLSNRPMTERTSRRWNNSRFQGEDFNDSLRRQVVALLEERGYRAVAPVLTS